jgi:hypothetical protein
MRVLVLLAVVILPACGRQLGRTPVPRPGKTLCPPWSFKEAAGLVEFLRGHGYIVSGPVRPAGEDTARMVVRGDLWKHRKPGETGAHLPLCADVAYATAFGEEDAYKPGTRLVIANESGRTIGEYWSDGRFVCYEEFTWP